MKGAFFNSCMKVIASCLKSGFPLAKPGPHYFLLMFILCLCFILSENAISDIISPNRCVDWKAYPPGVFGGIMTNRPIFCDVTTNAPGGVNARGDGITDDWPIIQYCINQCPSNHVVYLPKGTFLITKGLTLKSGVTLRGAGPENTIIMMTNWPAINPAGVFIWAGMNQTDTINSKSTNSIIVLDGAMQYSTNLVLASTSGLVPGGLALIDQENDPQYVGPSTEIGYTYLGRLSGTRTMGQIVELLSVTTSNVTFSPPLAYWYTNNAQLTPLKTVRRYIGLEDFGLSNAIPDNPSYLWLIAFGQTADSWIKNVHTFKTKRYHISLAGCFRCTVRECQMEGSYVYLPSNAYGLSLRDYSTACLVENNLTSSASPGLGPGFAMECAGPWNVVGYNYVHHVYSEYNGMMWAFSANHGAFSHMNLFEGNVGNGICADLTHAGSGWQTIFRNHFRGWEPNPSPLGSNTNDYQRAINICGSNYFYNVVGNVLGDPQLINPIWENKWTYEARTNNSSNSRPFIWRVGLIRTGESRDPSPNNWDQRTVDTLLRHGNYDYCSNNVAWDPTILDTNLPPSLYLKVKPDWFGDLPWPPIGPDVEGLTNIIPAQVRFLKTIMFSPTKVQGFQIIPPSL